jgi:sugar O-acyltransferase (sialic acid O-acetyltransferase NeuD family)
LKKLAIIGASDLGILIGHHVVISKTFDLIGYYDNFKTSVESGTYLGKTDSIEKDFREGKFDCMLIGIGYTNFFYRTHFFEFCKRLNIPLAIFKHPFSFVDESAELEEGVVILPGCVVDRNAVLEKNVFLNVSCTVAHDSRIGAHSFLSPAVNIAGFVHVGEKNFIGIGSTIINNLSVAAESIIGAGAVVVKNIETKGTYIGNPAKRIEEKTKN